MLYQSINSFNTSVWRFATLGISVVMFVALLQCNAEAQVSDQNYGLRESSAIDRIMNSGRPESLQIQYDGQVVRSSYEQERSLRPMTRQQFSPTGNTQPIPSNVDSERPNFIEREKQTTEPVTESSSKPKKQHFGKLIANLGMNLAFVLLVGIGFIVVAKQWIKPQGFGKKETSEQGSSSLEIQEELILDGKTKIRVVRWKNSDVLIASDPDGVKSMVALAPSFSKSLEQIEEVEELENEPPKPQKSKSSSSASKPEKKNESDSKGVDDRLIQMLLESANRSAKASKSYSRKGST